MPRSAPPALAARLSRLRKRLSALHLDSLLITYPADIRYLTGVSGDDSWALVTPRQLIIISDFRYQEELAAIRSFARIVIRSGAIADAAGALIADLKLKSIAFQAEHLTHRAHAAIAAITGAKRLRPTSELMTRLRAVKDDSEVQCIRTAARIQQKALRATLSAMKPNWSEADFAAHLEYTMKSLGAEGTGFTSIIAAQTNSSKPHYRPDARVKIRRNQPLLIDWGARFGGYTADMTRTFALGRFPKPIAEIYPIVLEAQLLAIQAAKPGARLVDVDRAARAHISNHGYGKQFGHGLGHGIGLDIHELPSLSPRSPEKETLVPGNVVTIEPGIYLPGVGGVRIEDDVLITKTGCTLLTDFPKSLSSAIL